MTMKDTSFNKTDASKSTLSNKSRVNPSLNNTSNSQFLLKVSSSHTLKNVESLYFSALNKYSLRRQAIRLGWDLMASTYLQHFRGSFGGVASIRYVDEENLAVGFISGHLLNYRSSSPWSAETLVSGCEGNYEISCLRIHPTTPALLYAASAQGTISMFDLSNTMNINNEPVITEEDNEINSFDLNEKGDILITGGYDATVRIYDTNTNQLIQQWGRLQTSSHSIPHTHSETFHEKRIYSVKHNPDESFIFATGGWDRSIKLWDTRIGNQCVRNISGPYLFGEAMDISKGSLLSASCEPNGDVELWDLGSGQLMDSVSLYHNGQIPYTVQFFKGDGNRDLVLVGGAGTGLQVVSIHQASIMYLFEEENVVNAVDSTQNKIAFGGKSHSIAFSTVCLHKHKHGQEIEISSSNSRTNSTLTCTN